MSKLTLSLLSNGALADGIAQNTVQIVAVDTTGVPIPLVGHVVTLSVDSGTVTPTSAATDANGSVSAALSSSAAGTVTLTALLDDGTTSTIPVEFTAINTLASSIPVPVAPVSSSSSEPISGVAALKANAAALAAKIEWVESRIAELGQEAEADVIALAEKYGLKL